MPVARVPLHESTGGRKGSSALPSSTGHCTADRLLHSCAGRRRSQIRRRIGSHEDAVLAFGFDPCALQAEEEDDYAEDAGKTLSDHEERGDQRQADYEGEEDGYRHYLAPWRLHERLGSNLRRRRRLAGRVDFLRFLVQTF